MDAKTAIKKRRNRKTVECNRKRRFRYRARIQALKESSPCADCGQKFPYYVMDFDHRDRSGKVADVSHLGRSGYSWDRVEAEIAKCDVVCVCCHRLRTYDGQNAYRTRRYNFHRAVLDELKSTTPCLDCGGSFDACQMDFDHLAGKSSTVARLMAEPKELLVDEIAKCHLVCANCHRARTHSGVRPEDLSQDLVQRFDEIEASTPYPEDRREVERPPSFLLGAMPDEDLAELSGFSKAMIGWFRRQEGTPPCRVKPGTASRPWHSLLGMIPDKEVAELAGLSIATIHYHRTRLGIARHMEMQIR